MTKKTTKTYAQTLAFTLSFSALSTSSHGMDPPDFFDPHIPENIKLGAKIFSSLDALDLMQTIQVNKNWKVLTDTTRRLHAPHRPWFLTRNIFGKELKKALSAEEDTLTPLLLSLRCAPFFEDIFLKDQTVRYYFDEVVQLWEDAWHMPKPSKFFFARLDSMIQKLNQRQENSKEYTGQISALIQVYEDFKQNLSGLSSKERSKVLKRSRLKTDAFPHWFMSEEKLEAVFSIAPTGSLLLQDRLGSSWVKPYPEPGEKAQFYFKYCKFNDLIEHREDSAFHPGMEWGIYKLSQLLGGMGVVPSTFLILNKNVKVQNLSESVKNTRRDLSHRATGKAESDRLEKSFEDFSWEPHVYGIQITPAVQGRTLLSYLTDDPQFRLDPKSFSFHILLALIARPVDYKGDNLLVNKFHEIIGIDNDLGLAFPVVKEDKGTFTEFKNILFCLPQMGEKVHIDAVKFYQDLNPESMILEWLGALSHQNKRYELLLKSQDVSEEIWERIHLPLKLHPQTISQMMADLCKLKGLLTKEGITHRELFSGLWPQVALYYETLVKSHGPLKAWECIYGGAAHQGNGLPFEKVLPNFDPFFNQGPLPCIGDYRKRTLSPEKAVEEILDQLGAKVSNLSPDELNTFADKILKYFPEKLEKPSRGKYFDKNTLLKALGAQHPSERIINFLIQRFGKDVTNELGENLLHLSVKHNHADLLKKLLDQSVSYKAKDQLGLTPLDCALRQSHHEMIKMLMDKGASPHMNAHIGLKYYKDHKETRQEIIEPLLTQHMEFAWTAALEEILPPRAHGLLIKGATLGPRVLPDSIHQQLYSRKGMIKKNTTGRHCVNHVKVGPHTLYFKEYPEIPGFEEAVGSLGRLLFGDLTPYVELFEMYGKPVLVSYGIPGETFQEAMKRDPHQWDKLDQEQLAALTLLSYLTNPEDGKPDNLQLWNNKLYSIDNDHAFVQAVAKEEKKGFFQSLFQGPIVQVKTMLYSMEHMHKSVPERLRQKLLKFDIGRNLNEWLIALKSKTQGYHLLFDDEQTRLKLFETHECYLGFPFDQKKIEPLYEKIIALKDLIYHNPKITLFEILQGLEKELSDRYNPTLTSEMVANFSAKVGQFYEKNETQDPQESAFRREFFSSLQRLKQAIGLKLFEALPTENNLWRMYIRFLFVDGEFYLRDKRGSLTTLSTSKDLLLSQALPWKEGLLSSLHHRNVDNAKATQDALKALMERQAQIEGVPLHEIRDDKILEKKLKATKFKEMGATQQLEIIKALKTRKLSRVSLVNSIETDDLIRDHLNFRYLQHLDLRGCQGITDGLFPILSKKAPLLEVLNCANTNVTEIGKRSQPIKFKELKILCLDSCSSLMHLYLKAPFLKEIRLEGCTKLKFINIHAPLLKEIKLEGCTKLEKIQCKGTLERLFLDEKSSLSKDTLKKIVEDNPTLQVVSFGKRFVGVSFLKSMPDNFMESVYCIKGTAYFFLDQEFSEDEAWLMSSFYSDMESLDLHDPGSDEGLDDAQIKKLIPILQHMTKLTSLNLESNNIGDPGALALAKTMTQLRELNLARNQIGDPGVLALAKTMTQLRELDLHWNRIGDISAQAIAQTMTQLTILDLSNWLTSDNKVIGDAGAQAISQTMTQLRELKLEHNKIGDLGALAIAQYMTQLTELDLRGNKIGDKGAQAIAQYMMQLKELRLQFNQIGDLGAQTIAQYMTRLTNLCLNSNQIGDTGAQAIAKYMRQLTSLALQCNQIGDPGALALAQTMTQLRELDLHWNRIGDISAQAIAQTMTQLTWLDLSCNQIGDTGAQAIAKYMRQLTSLALQCNQIGDPGALALAQTMTQLTWLNLENNKITNPDLKKLPSKRKTLREAVSPAPNPVPVISQQKSAKTETPAQVIPPQITPVQPRAQLTEIQKLNVWGKETR